MTNRGHLTQKQKAELLIRQDGKCALPDCRKRLIPGLFQFDHIQDLQHDGDNELDNWQVICTKPCHQLKTKRGIQARAHADRIAVGGKQRSPSRPMPGTKRSGLRKRFNGQVERW